LHASTIMLARILSLALVLSLACLAACTDEATSPGGACGPARLYAIDRVQVPTSLDERRALALDLDRDGTVDNGLGNLIVAARSWNPDIADPNPTLNARLTSDDQTWLLAVSDCADGTRDVQIGHSGGGDEVPLTALVDPLGSFGPIAWVRADLVTSRLQLDDAAGTVDGVIGFALPVPAAGHALAAPFAAYLTAELRAGTSPYAAQTDTDHDGVVSPDEMLASPVMKALMAPDVSRSGPGGVRDALSAGVGVHATLVIE
jgi:hypothetical protein